MASVKARVNKVQRRLEKNSKAKHCHTVLSTVRLYLYTFHITHVLSSIHSSKTLHALFPHSFQKTSHAGSQQNILPHVSLNKTSSHKICSRENIIWHIWIFKETRNFHFNPSMVIEYFAGYSKVASICDFVDSEAQFFKGFWLLESILISYV